MRKAILAALGMALVLAGGLGAAVYVTTVHVEIPYSCTTPNKGTRVCSGTAKTDVQVTFTTPETTTATTATTTTAPTTTAITTTTTTTAPTTTAVDPRLAPLTLPNPLPGDITDTSIYMDWSSADPTRTGYRMYYKPTGGSESSQDFPGSYGTVTGLTPATTYSFQVVALFADGAMTARSNTVTATTLSAPPPPPPPPGDLPYFVGDFDTGNLSQWHYLGDAGLNRNPVGTVVVTSPTFNSPFAARFITIDLSGTGVNGDGAYVEDPGGAGFQAPWEQIGGDAWYHAYILLPSGNDPRYPGSWTMNPTSGWNAFIEWHNRTDAASGWPNVCPCYLSPLIAVHNNGNGTGSWEFRTAGGTPANPILHSFYAPCCVQKDRWYEMTLRMKNGSTPATSYYEWYVDGTLIVSGSDYPTAYLLPDGTSGELFEEGHYRGHASWQDTVYIDGTKVGPTRTSVGG